MQSKNHQPLKQPTMTVKQLNEALEKYPDTMDVFMAKRKTQFAYGLLNSVSVRTVTFVEDPFDIEMKEDWEEEAPKWECVILDEE